MTQSASDIITSSYQNFFGRDPEQGGMDHWMSVAGGMGDDLSQLDDKIFASAQGNDRRGIVNNAYNDLFGHNADEQGLDFWSGDFWDQHWAGGNVTQDDIWSRIGAGASGDDEQLLLDRLVGDDMRPSLNVFRDPARADTFWQNLNDPDGALTGASGNAGGAGTSPQTDLENLYRLLFQNSPQQQQQPASGAGQQNGENPNDWFMGRLRDAIQAGQNPPQIDTPETLAGTDYRAYMDPYIQDVFGSAAREISDTYSRRIGDMTGAANMAGAYGDDTYSDAYRSLARDEAETLGDLRSRINSEAYQNATSLRNTDINRALQVAIQNAGLNQNQQGLNLQGIGMGLGQGNTDRSIDLQALGLGSNIDLANRQFDLESLLAMDQNQINWLNTLLGMDNYNRTWEQAALDREYQDFWNQAMWPIYLTNLGVGWAGGIPSNSVNISTTSAPNNTMWSSLGSIL